MSDEYLARYFLSMWCLAIWDPSRMDFITNAKRRHQRKLFYRTMGIVVHDRALNGQPIWKEINENI